MEDDWHVVVKTKPRDFFDMFEDNTVQGITQDDVELWREQDLDEITFTLNGDVTWVRQGLAGTEVEVVTRERPNDD